MLQQFGEEIWIADGSVVDVAGFRYPTRTAIIRLAGGGLFIWSPIALSDELRAAVDALGPVRHIIAPNSLHHLSVPDWQRAWPEAKTWAAPGLRKKRPDIDFEGELGNEPPQGWAGEIDQVLMEGNRITTEVVFFHAGSGTAIFTDLLQHFPDGWFSGWRAVVAKLDLMVAPEPSVPRKFRLAFTNRQAARAALRRVLAWPVQKVLMAHGPAVTDEGAALIRRAFLWLDH